MLNYRVLLPLLAGLACTAAHAEPDTLAKVRSAGKLVIGTRDSSAPLAYTTGNGQYTGYHVEICQRVAEAVQAELKLPRLPVEYSLVTSQNRVLLLMNGSIDLECGSTTNNRARQAQVAFAPTTYVTRVRTAVKAASGISSIAQLNGKKVATTTGTTSVQLLRKHERAQGVKFEAVYGKDHADSFLLLETGRADAFVMDDNILAGLIANAKAPADYRIVGESLNEEPIAIMYRKGDPGIKRVVDGAITAMMKRGDIDKLYAKWFLQPIPPRNVAVNMPMSAALKDAIAHPNDRPAEDYAPK
jgi:glutamate/aspartate transport system substrate-binding protein